MHIQDIFAQHRTTFSFEFFPPKTDEASEALFKTIASLQELQPSFVSVTYGAGGSTRERTHDLVVRIEKETDLTAVSHLTCVCHNLDEMTAILDRYAESGIKNVLALSGDPPRTMPDHDRSQDAFRYAEQLVRFIKSRTNAPDRRGFGIGVAGFPEGHPGMPEPREGDGLPESEGGCRRGLHLHAALLRQPRLLRLPRALRTGRHQGADRRRHHAGRVEEGDGARWPRWPLGARYPAKLLRAVEPLRGR